MVYKGLMPAHTHKTFLNNLRKSEASVLMVAHWIATSGGRVVYHPPTEAPTHEAWKTHADQGDLTLSLRLEVKKISRPFTGPHDWPFKDFIVCAKHSWDQAFPKPFGFFYLNPGETHAAFVSGFSWPAWRVENRPDRRYSGYRQDFYIAEKALPVFWDLSLPVPYPFGSSGG